MTFLTIEQALEIYYKVKNKVPKVLICDEYKINPSTIYSIEACRNRWKCLLPYINK